MKNAVLAMVFVLAVVTTSFTMAEEALSYNSFNAKKAVPCGTATNAEDLENALIEAGWNNAFPDVDFSTYFAVLVAKPGLKQNMLLKRASKSEDRFVIEWHLQPVKGSSRQGKGYADFGSTAPLDQLLVLVPISVATPEETVCRGPE